MYAAFACMQYLHVCSIYMYAAFTCMWHLHVCSIYTCMHVSTNKSLQSQCVILGHLLHVHLTVSFNYSSNNLFGLSDPQMPEHYSSYQLKYLHKHSFVRSAFLYDCFE